MNSYSTNQLGQSRQPGGSRFAGAPLSKWLMIVLLATFIIDSTGAGESRRLVPWFALSSSNLAEIWRWLTYPLVDLQLGAWLFGMITLYAFGRMVEQSIGSRRFGVFILLCTLVGVVIFSLASVGSDFQILSGTTGISFAIITFAALLYPNLTVQLLIPPVPLKLKTLAIGLLIIAAVMMIAQQRNSAVSLAYLSGAGLAYIISCKNQILDIGKSKIHKSPKKRAKKRAKKKGGMRPRTVINVKETEVDEILDKVSREGIGNLTDEEREILKFASKK